MAPQAEFVPQDWKASPNDKPGQPSVFLESRNQRLSCDFSFELLRPNLFRTTFTSKDHPLPPHPSAPLPEQDLGSEEPQVTSSSTSKKITHSGVSATVTWTATPIISLQFSSAPAPMHTDLPFRSYALDGDGAAHYTRYNRDTLHVGLGEKAAPMDLSNRHFVLSATDCFGYDVHRTDPLYKHIPLLINATPAGVVAVFSTSHSRGFYSVGSEMDGMWGPFKVYRQDHGGLEEYLIAGKTLKEVVQTYAGLVGMPLRIPRWAFGYLAGGMKYSMSDDPPAVDVLMEFAEKLKEHDIPCSGFQLSSGYTMAETEPKTRNVFTWNNHRFPSPSAFTNAYHIHGLRLLANLKPYLLATHPSYPALASAGALFTSPSDPPLDPPSDPTHTPSAPPPAATRLWSAGGATSATGSHLDFTSRATQHWWAAGVRALREQGVDAMWNDNNEFTLPDDAWQCALDDEDAAATTRRDIGLWGRALHTELMARTSHAALLEAGPADERPFVLTRSATAGTLRYAGASWSGDNVTSWPSLRGSTALTLGAGLCLLHAYGHDVGGFEGPQPSPELLVRWCQASVYGARFAINCFKTGEDASAGDVIEPWMYGPAVTALVRDAVKRRYEVLPYIYSAHLESHRAAVPPVRWTGWGYEGDGEVWCEELRGGETQGWFGGAVLVGGVGGEGVERGRVYLPDDGVGGGFVNLNKPWQYLEGGQWVEIEAKWRESIPVLAKVGGVIPVGRDVQTRAPGEKENPAGLPEDDYRGVEIFPARAGGKWFEATWYEDDGVTVSGTISSFTLRYSATEEEVVVEFAAGINGFTPPWKDLHVILPVGDKRRVVDRGGKQLKSAGTDKKGRAVQTLESVL